MSNPENARITHRKTDFEEIDKLGPDKSRYWQIDFIKAFAMVLVIMDHSIPHELLHELGSPFWQRIAIPLFLIVIGFNWSKSMEKRKNLPLKKLYSWDFYLKKKLIRFFLPFGIIYALSLIFYFLIIRRIDSYFLMYIYGYGDPMLKLILFLPVWGPGNWFIPLLFITILIFPILYKAFSKKPGISLLVCFILEFSWYVFILYVTVFWEQRDRVPIGVWNYFNTITILRDTPFRALTAIGAGIWLSKDHRWNTLRNIIIWIWGIASFVYLFFYTFRNFQFAVHIGDEVYALFSGDYNMLHFGWSALLVMLALNIFPKEPIGNGFRFITTISKSTYHILMVQIFYFSIIYNLLLPLFGNPPFYSDPIWASIGGDDYWINYLWYYPVNLLVTFSLGMLWYNLENKFIWEKNKLARKKRLEHAKARGWIK